MTGQGGETPATRAGDPTGDEAYCASCGGSFSPELTTCPNDGVKLVRFAAKQDALLGKVLDGRYEIRSALGEGGMGTVYRGWQLSVDREVAIKVVHPSIANEREAAKRFLREARVSSRLNAPGIVNVYDFGQSDGGVLYLVMELLKGHSLSDIIEATGPMPARRVMTMALQLCDALESAHALGIVHRDLKPGNIIVLADPPGRDALKVLDFGLAKATAGEVSAITNTHAMLGTPLYMAPEQIEGAAVDNRTDLYALGVILFELLTGSTPYSEQSIQGILTRHLTQEVPDLGPNVHPALGAIVKRLLAKQPAARWASAAELREALYRVQSVLGTPPAGMPIVDASASMPFAPYQSAAIPAAAAQSQPMIGVPGPSTGAVSSPQLPPRKRSLGIILGTVVTLCVAGGVALALLGKPETPAVTPAPAFEPERMEPAATPPTTTTESKTVVPTPEPTPTPTPTPDPIPSEPTPTAGSGSGAQPDDLSFVNGGKDDKDKKRKRDKKRGDRKKDSTTKPGATDLDFLK